MTEERNWFRILSPCLLACLLSVPAIFLNFLVFLPLSLLFFLLDILLKELIKKASSLWIAESVFVVMIAFMYISSVLD